MSQSMFEMASSLLWLLMLDVAFMAIFILLLIPMSMYRHAAFAVLRRNFVGYFNNPTGYIFLCVFVILTSLAAFWPHEFFNDNLANLDQLNLYIPLIMLVFIPAITMSIWAEERRQGTDELLLTIPADDFDIVLGKYLAAVAIFTASLLFSQVSTFLVLVSLSLGEVDTGLFFSTYLGYWLLGLAMLAIGMVASFLTNNLTVGFILGGLFNAPLAAASYADVVIGNNTVARFIEKWSFGQQFEDLGRGVISLSSLTYFLLITAVGVYLCIVLIGRRHWMGGQKGNAMLFHFLLRTLALIAIALGANALFVQYDFRQDVTRDQISSLALETRQTMQRLDPEYPIKIEAFISNEVPEQYAQTKKNLISKLKELKAQGGNMIDLTIYDNLEPSSPEAIMAEARYGISPRSVPVTSRGAPSNELVLMGVAVASGVEKVVVPFIDSGIPIEYELIRSIATVSQSERKKIGIVRTDAQVFGGFSFAGGQPRQIPKLAIIAELEKQYEVEEVDPENPIDPDKYRALLVVQPSSLSQAQLDNVIAAIAEGAPTAIFEDPMPHLLPYVPGTGEPKPPAGMFGGPPQEKADLSPLMELLGIEMITKNDPFSGAEQPLVVWQRFNPYPKLRRVDFVTPEWVFIRDEIYQPKKDELLPFNPNVKLSKGLEEVLFIRPGAIREREAASTTFQPLVMTGDVAGTIAPATVRQHEGDWSKLDQERGKSVEGRRYTLSAWIRGPEEQKPETEGGAQKNESENQAESGEEAESPRDSDDSRPLSVIFTADIDLMSNQFVDIRASRDAFINFRFDNVTLVLNMLDALSGDETFLDIRKRKVRHGTLRMIEQLTEDAQAKAEREQAEYVQNTKDALAKARAEMEQQTADVQKQLDALAQKQVRGEPIDYEEARRLQQQKQFREARAAARFQVQQEQLTLDQNRNLKRIQQELDQQIRQTQNKYKIAALLFPVIPPLLIGLIVFVRRRMREREGLSRDRLK